MAESSVHRPKLVILAGPNGAGKTTTAMLLLPDELRIQPFVNADTIAAGLSAFSPESVAFQAGRIMLARLNDLVERREDFSFETTLSSRSFGPFLRRAKASGYFVAIMYVWLSSAELSLERVANRVRRGGHSVPEADVRRRYARGVSNFLHLYRPLADAWVLANNTGESPVIVARGVRQETREVVDPETYDAIIRSAGRS